MICTIVHQNSRSTLISPTGVLALAYVKISLAIALAGGVCHILAYVKISLHGQNTCAKLIA